MNTSFLQRVAQTFWREKQEQVSELTFVFPNQRAGLFFRKYLAAEAGKTIFAPTVLTINQLFQQLSSLQLADNIDLLFRLYQVYIAERKTQETFDDFLFWGRMMISDFNEVDQHLVDASQLFTNLRDLKELEQQFSMLTEEQVESVNAFVHSMHAGDTNAFRKQFLTIWNTLLPIYTRFREELRNDGLAYMGMLQRAVIETPHSAPRTSHPTYIFIGFNALTGVEKALMEQLRDSAQADFYWDYEAEWLRDPQNRASLFYQPNIAAFPSQYTIPHIPLTAPTIHWVRVASSVGQAEVIQKLLQNTDQSSQVNWTQVGIVLPNEHMLQPILKAIPNDIKHINITMGQPLRQTAVYALLLHLSELAVLSTDQHKDSDKADKAWLYYKPLMSLLHHPYVQAVAPEEITTLQAQVLNNNWVFVEAEQLSAYAFLQQLFILPTTPQAVLEHLRTFIYAFAQHDDIQALDKEYLYQLLLIVNRVEGILQQHKVLISIKTLYQILLQLLEGTTVPFTGEPLQGLQIMGMLESRSMDFHTLILTDVNEETLPGKTMQNTYIPYDLRLYFGLPTAERQDAIFAYNFYRLLSHADDVWLLQNTLSNDMTSGEVSRYVYQLQYQYNLPIETIDVNHIPAAPDLKLPLVEKTEEVITEVRNMLENRGLSPSTLNTYLACPLRFYWGTVHQLIEPKTIQEDIAPNQLGTVLHSIMEELYGKPQAPYKVSEKDIVTMLQKVSKTPLVELHYAKEFYKANDTTPITGRDQLAIHAIKKYVRNILEHDKTLCPFFYHASEQYLATEVTTATGQVVRIKGLIDRIDAMNGQVRVVDYKTGANHSRKAAMAELFTPAKGKDYDYYRQTLFYALLYTANHPDTDCGATIYYTTKQPSAIEDALFSSFAEQEGFTDSLTVVLDEILNKEIPFMACPSQKNCEYCPFAAMCQQ